MKVKIIYQSKRDACFPDNVYYYPEDGYTPADRVEKIKAISESNFSTTLGNLDRVEITQFTGLVDKNGKDIYDGDILKSLGTDIRVVECDNANACYVMRCQFSRGRYVPVQ